MVTVTTVADAPPANSPEVVTRNRSADPARPRFRAARAVVAVTALFGAGAIALAVLGALGIATADAWAAGVVIAVWAVVALVVATRSRQLWTPLTTAAAALAAGAVLALHPSTASSADLWTTVALTILGGALGQLAVSLPDGSLDGRRWLAVAAGYGIALLAALWLVEGDGDPTAVVVVWAAALALIAAPCVLGRCRMAGTADRARLQWAGWAALVMATSSILAVVVSALTGWPDHAGSVAMATTTAMPLALVASTVDRLLPFAPRTLAHTIVGAGMALAAAAVYSLVVVGFNGSPSDEEQAVLGLSIVATVAIAVLALPTRRRLEGFANQRVYGERQAPDTALHTMANRMSRAVPMDELLLQLAETLRRTMHLDRAEIWTGDGGMLDLTVSVPDRPRQRVTFGEAERDVAARTPVAGNAWLAIWAPSLLDGRDDQHVRVASVAHLGELLGLIVTVRAADEGELDEEQDRVLTDIARQLGLALHNVRLDTALQASLDELQVRNAELVVSRARIVAAADESRRQIERNLHDGAQQHLVAMAVKLGLARQLLDADPVTASTLVEELREDVQATLTELRELAHGIYPPLLRSRGLPEALTAAANRAVLSTTVLAADLGRFDPDVEAAVYFCCLEAIQNAGKHAGDGASISITVGHAAGELEFAVSDDGAGFDPTAVAGGHGFVNMTDRLGARGGTLTVTSAPGSGTTIAGRLPADPLGD